KDSEIPGIEYYVIDGANPGGAINPMQADPGPVVYFDTDDIDASIAKVRDLGGKSDDKMPIPSQGWFAACVDSEGNKFSLYQNPPSVTMETEQQAASAYRPGGRRSPSSGSTGGLNRPVLDPH